MHSSKFIRKLLLEAAHRQGWKADKWIARGLGVSQPMPSMWRNGERMPSDDVMLAICQAAGYPPRLGLLELHQIKARNADVAAIFAELVDRERADQGKREDNEAA